MLRNSNTHYSILARLLHWGMAVLILIALVSVELHELFPKGSALRSALMATHFQTGLVIFALTWLRINQFAFNPPPAITPEPPRWQKIAARLMHAALYLAMIALPALGVLMLQANDKPVTLLGMPLPVFIGADKPLAKALKETHEAIGNLMIALILAHVAAAIWHHVVQKDSTLRRMLPGRCADASHAGKASRASR